MKFGPEDYEDPEAKRIIADIQDPSTGMADSIDIGAAKMLVTLLGGPRMWERIIVPELEPNSAKLLVRLAAEDEDVANILRGSWMQAQQVGINNFIARRFHDMEIWAMEAGRHDLLQMTSEMVDRAMKDG